MARRRAPGVLVAVFAMVVAYHWLGLESLLIGLFAFVIYEMLAPPPRYRGLGPGQIQEAQDNRFGMFGRTIARMNPIASRRGPVETIPAPAAAA
jgi:hypothetical protein